MDSVSVALPSTLGRPALLLPLNSLGRRGKAPLGVRASAEGDAADLQATETKAAESPRGGHAWKLAGVLDEAYKSISHSAESRRLLHDLWACEKFQERCPSLARDARPGRYISDSFAYPLRIDFEWHAWHNIRNTEGSGEIPTFLLPFFRADQFGNVVSIFGRPNTPCAFTALPRSLNTTHAPHAFYFGLEETLKRGNDPTLLTTAGLGNTSLGLRVKDFLTLLEDVKGLVVPKGSDEEVVSTLIRVLCTKKYGEVDTGVYSKKCDLSSLSPPLLQQLQDNLKKNKEA